MTERLTDKRVRDLPPPASGGNKVYYDEDVRGLGVRVTSAGARSWVFNYRASGVERRLTIGDTKAWTVRAARDKANELRRLVDNGGDPMADRHAQRAAPTMTELATQYLEYAKTRKRPRSLAEDRAMINGVILPALGKTRVSALTRPDVARLHADVSKRAPVRANRVISLLRRMLNLATTEFGMREGPNPATAIERNAEARRTRYLEPDELARLMVAIGAHRNQQSANIVRLALLTGARRGELLGATWPQFNLSSTGTWTRPASLTKQKKMHTIPLNGPARAVLAAMKEAADQENARRARDGLRALVHLFPGYGSNDAQGDLKRTWAAICKAAGLVDLRFHDLRHSFASFLASSGHNLPLIGQMLGHSNPATTNRYSHLLMDPQREAAERVGSIVTGAGNGGGDVVPMASGKRT
jgi:integrase